MILLNWSFHLGKNEVIFVKIGARALVLRLDMSFGPKWPKFSFQTPDPDFGENEVLFVKIGARVLDLRLDMSFWLWWPICSLKASDPKVKIFFVIS